MNYKINTLQSLGVKLHPQRAAFVIEYLKDFDDRRAARVVGLPADQGKKVLEEDEVKAALAHVMLNRMQTADYDVEWVMHEMADNHKLARYEKNLSASNIALSNMAKLNLIDAFAAEKVHIASGGEVAERLLRARKRAVAKGDQE